MRVFKAGYKLANTSEYFFPSREVFTTRDFALD